MDTRDVLNSWVDMLGNSQRTKETQVFVLKVA